MSENKVQTSVVTEKLGKTSLLTQAMRYVPVTGAGVIAMSAIGANAAEGALDMSEATGTLVLALAAIGALGAAKIAPAALTWVWSMVTGMAKRG